MPRRVANGAPRVVCTGVLAALLTVAPSAGPAGATAAERRAAPHPEVVAAVTCAGRVNYGVTAWVGQSDDPATAEDERDRGRTNPSVAVAYSTDGGRTFTDLPVPPSHHFAHANKYQFDDSFPLPLPVPRRLVLRARAESRWGDGQDPGEARYFGPVQIPNCVLALPGVAAPLPVRAGPVVAADAARFVQLDPAPPRPGPRFVPMAILLAAAVLLVLLGAGVWARDRIARL